ncbi:MAG: methylated-DNA--[Clostridia bacterium]|nr:methylated-DNA--[protein]-cysteine S-methyltransferase [Clostridia bacterium]
MAEIFAWLIPSPIGTLALLEQDQMIIRLTCSASLPDNIIYNKTPLLAEAEKQINEYFAGSRRDFTLPLKVTGSSFAIKVYNALLDIPYGETRSYKEIAEAAGSPKAFRAVGRANHDNPIMLIVPCHRVIGSNGKMTGYAYGTDMKKYLLEHEKQYHE